GGGRSPRVGRDQQDPFAARLKIARQLAAGGRFAYPLKTDQHNDGRRVRRQIQRRLLGPHERTELFPHDFDNLMAGCEALEDFLSNSFRPDALDKVLDDFEIDVRFQNSYTDLFKIVAELS